MPPVIRIPPFCPTLLARAIAARFSVSMRSTRPRSQPFPSQAVAAVIEQLAADGVEDPVVVMVGDGATDLEAKPPAQAVIGFGGVVTRDVVRDKSDWFVTDFTEVTEIVVGSEQVED